MIVLTKIKTDVLLSAIKAIEKAEKNLYNDKLAHTLGAGGRRFKSSHPDITFL